jgi:ABC-2 type transport system permease protein
MTLWRLEWLRLVRTRRAVTLVFVFLLVGFGGPALARYMETLVRSGTTGGVTIVVPPPVAADGIAQFSKNAQQLGIIAVVVVAAGALALDATPGLSLFYRTRVQRVSTLLLPRVVVPAVAAVAAYALGAAAAWYETVALLGLLDGGRVVAGAALAALYLVFAVAVTAAASTVVRSTLATVGTAMAVLVLLPVGGVVPHLERWLPSHLAGAQDAVVRGAHLSSYLPATAITSAAVVLLVAGAMARSAAREVVR